MLAYRRLLFSILTIRNRSLRLSPPLPFGRNAGAGPHYYGPDGGTSGGPQRGPRREVQARSRREHVLHREEILSYQTLDATLGDVNDYLLHVVAGSLSALCLLTKEMCLRAFLKNRIYI